MYPYLLLDVLCLPVVIIYQVHVYTSKMEGAATNGNVYITVYGERGDSGKRLLLTSNNDTKFRSGRVRIV